VKNTASAVPVRSTETETIPTSVAINRLINSMFKIGEMVVHPQHGVGEIVMLEDREFDELGKPRRYYKISMPGASTIWVPVDNPNPGLRYLATKSEIADCRKILAARPLPLMVDGRVNQPELVARVKQGTIAVQCEVVRDLSAFLAQRPPYGTTGVLLEAIQVVLCQEWAIVEGIPISEATSEINSLLEKSRSTIARK
jgi:RNA polymerase-interacting CarD/CdnL/TRCF family regulator